MKTSRIRLLSFLPATLIVLALVTTPLIAQGSLQSRWWSNPRVVEGLGLSDEQQARIDSIAFEAESRGIDLKADERKANLELARLLDQPDFDQEAVNATIDRIVDARCAQTRQGLESRAAIAAILSREQRVKLMDFLDKVRERRGEMRRAPRGRR